MILIFNSTPRETGDDQSHIFPYCGEKSLMQKLSHSRTRSDISDISLPNRPDNDIPLHY